jgi:hypothetical protein
MSSNSSVALQPFSPGNQTLESVTLFKLFALHRLLLSVAVMHRSLFSWASALAVASLVTISSAGVAGISPREADDGLEKRLLCVGDSLNEVFQSVGMGSANNGVQADITAFCRSWIDIPGTTSYVQTVTPTLYAGRSHFCSETWTQADFLVHHFPRQ